MAIFILFIVLGVILVILMAYLILRRPFCPACKSKDVNRTGKKLVKDDPLNGLFGNSTIHEFENKCNNCGYLFWEKYGSTIFS